LPADLLLADQYQPALVEFRYRLLDGSQAGRHFLGYPLHSVPHAFVTSVDFADDELGHPELGVGDVAARMDVIRPLGAIDVKTVGIVFCHSPLCHS